jgi:hypothetical protein
MEVPSIAHQGLVLQPFQLSPRRFGIGGDFLRESGFTTSRSLMGSKRPVLSFGRTTRFISPGCWTQGRSTESRLRCLQYLRRMLKRSPLSQISA